ncbi:uncharacterized protein LOC127846391 [Dreissena polymorpha]|uniref:Uncharacterized protein n=1 Tax=Dreissena polymorpha TaxID=45954 RepID=A0A9D4DVL3_DREPO|nr:uncharacterized protein LOC127846391 [Dreissena polymorpha]XP_052233565.1 uncharacterized protein LOC127846391 [Dreissena polymorpha]KAH3768421.1 hypothetical protein DPMN_169633 [Dreissena polymorpha]
MKVLIIVILVAMAIMPSVVDGQYSCLNLTDCQCGNVCVNELDKSCEGPRDSCRCKPGCLVFDLFIKPGEGRRVYGNTCRCPLSPQASNGVSACTRAAWRGQPAGIPTYPTSC